MEHVTLSREDVDPNAIIAQLQRKMCHFVTLVGDLGAQLSSEKCKSACLQHVLEEEQNILKNIYEQYEREKIERELACKELKKYKEKAESVSGEVTSDGEPFEQTVEIVMARLKQENGTLIQQIEENIETHHRTTELCKYRAKIAKLEKETVMLQQKNSELELKSMGNCECTHSVKERTTFNISSLQCLVKMLEANCCEWKCRMGYTTTENTGVQESGQYQGDQVVPTSSPPSQVVCEETGSSIEDHWRWMDMNKNDDFFYMTQAPPMLCPDSLWADIKSKIQRNPRNSLKKVNNQPVLQSGADEIESKPFVKMPLKASMSLPVL